MKKILAVILATAIMAFSGCSTALSEKEYYDRFMESYKTYNSQVIAVAADIASLSLGSDLDWDDFKDSLDNVRSSLESIEKLSPPAIYSAQHREICEKMKPEKDWCGAVEQIIRDGGISEDSLSKMETAAVESEFHSVVLYLVKQMRNDGLGEQQK